MKKSIPILAVAFFILAIWSSFSSAFAAIHQGGKYRKVMNGNDTTYGSTGRCTLHSAPSSRTTLGLVGGELLAWTVDGGWY